MIAARAVRYLARIAGRLDESEEARRRLAWIAILVGILWTAAAGLWLGIRAGGDTEGHLAAAALIRSEGISWTILYGDRRGLYHWTYLWIALLGPTGFVVLTALLTALLPFFLLRVLRHCGVRTSLCISALAYAAINPELYKWAFYLLTDGFLLAQVMAWLALVTWPQLSGPWWGLVPFLWYGVLHTRPSGVFLIPALLGFSLWAPDRSRRWFLALLAVAAVAWSLGLFVSGRGGGNLHLAWGRENFVTGSLLGDPRMGDPLPVPFTQEEAENKSVVELCAGYARYCAEYFVRKFFLFLVPVFPRYSLRHRLFNLLYFGSLFLLSAAGMVMLIRRLRREGGAWIEDRRLAFATYLLCGTVVATAAIVLTATHIDSDARNLIVWTVPWICFVFLQFDLVSGRLPVADSVPVGARAVEQI